MLVVAKPSGLLSVPGLGEDNQDCLIRRIQESMPEARIVHRLDRDTSGLLVLARDADTHRELSRQFHDREVDKRYIALIHGSPADDGGEITLPLRYDPPTKPRHVVDLENGQSARTLWQVIERHDTFTRVALVPYTGRSHQLRVHMQALGHPIMGDALYGPASDPTERLCLHAESLGFTHPVGREHLRFSLPEPF